MFDDVKYKVFTKKYDGIRKTIKTNLKVLTDDGVYDAIALWDTGANVSEISYEFVDILKPDLAGVVKINTPTGTKMTDAYYIDILLPNNKKMKDLFVCESQIGNQGIDILIGMDIISMGDFCITNYKDSTMFSFRMPSKRYIDFTRWFSI